MSILFASEMGFCTGVRRAVALLEKALDEDRDNPPATFGPLVHNPRLLEEYRARGVRIITSPEEVFPGDRLLLRAHGVPRKQKEALNARGAEIIDATCPKVAASMRKAREAEKEGRMVILAGDPGHGEMKAVAGVLEDPESTLVVEGVEDVSKLIFERPVTLIAQTTFEQGTYQKIVEFLSRISADLMVHQTICPATARRQKSLRELAEKTDAIIVVGGRTSANTHRLYEIALQCGVATWHIETADELGPFICKYRSLGISAGASTPQSEIDRVAQRAGELRGEKIF